MSGNLSIGKTGLALFDVVKAKHATRDHRGDVIMMTVGDDGENKRCVCEVTLPLEYETTI